jgi:hypothetical protein
MSQTRPARRPPPRGDWRLQQIAVRTDWRGDSDSCSACDETVDLVDVHCQAELGRHLSPTADRKLTYERRLLFFCDEACVVEWIDESDAEW